MRLNQALTHFVRPSSLENIRTIYSNTISADYARTNIHPLVIHEDNISLRHLLAILTPNGPPDSIWNLSFNRRLMQIVLSLPAKARYVGKCAQSVVGLVEASPAYRLCEGDCQLRFLGSIREGVPLCKIQAFRNIPRGQRLRQEPSLATVRYSGLELPSHTRHEDRSRRARRDPQYFPLISCSPATRR